MKRFLVAAIAALLVGAFLFPASVVAKPTKTDICHLSPDTGLFALISVPDGAVDNHIAHGDVLAGDCDALNAGTGLATIKARGFVRCGVHESLPGFSLATGGDPTTSVGFEADLCRVVAAAVFGDSDAVEFVFVTGASRFTALRDGTVDVVMRTSTNNLSRDALFANGGAGLNFGPTYFYDGQGFIVNGAAMGAITVDSTIADFPDSTTICVVDTTAHEERIALAESDLGKEWNIEALPDTSALLSAFAAGTCDVVTHDLIALGEFGSQSFTTILLGQTISKEPLAPVVADGDDEWMSVVRWSVNAVIFADELGITSSNINSIIGTTDSFDVCAAFDPECLVMTGPQLGLTQSWAYDAITQVGNYGEIYTEHLEPIGLARAGTLNDSYVDGGLLYAPPIR